MNRHPIFALLVTLALAPAATVRADDLLDQLRARQAAQRAAAAGDTPAPTPGSPTPAPPAGPAAVYTGQLERLEGCTLAPNVANDGDSFHVLHRGRELLFRLYFVDCLETNAAFPERVAEQAAYFQVPAEAAPRFGKEAAQVTRNLLGTRPFTVWTAWRDARGRSRLQRFYAFVIFTDMMGRKADLGETLVGAGLARIFGLTVTTPEGVGAPAYKIKLSALERQAQSQRRGAWSDAK